MTRITQIMTANNFIQGQATNFGALPNAASHTGETWMVLYGSGTYILNYQDAGPYYSDGASWFRLGKLYLYFDTTNFKLNDGADPLKTMNFDLTAIASNNLRTISMPNRSLTLDNITTSTTTNGTGFVKGNGTVISFDNSTYLTSVGTGVANEITFWSGVNTLGSLATDTYPSLTELSYVKGVTSAIQTQLGGKEPTLAKGNLTELTSSVLTVTGGTGAIIGAGVTIEVDQADTSNDGYLSATDWNTFNGKQATITWGDGLESAAGTASVDYNTTNLKITATELDTIQSIATTASPTFTGFTNESAFIIKEIATPANPSAGYVKFYSKAGDKLYYLTPAGVESEVGAGGGAGVEQILMLGGM